MLFVKLLVYLAYMESIGSLLGRLTPKEPDEIRLAKEYIQTEFQANASVAIKNETLVITVTSAPLANMLRLRAAALQDACKTSKRLVFRIG